MNLYVVIRYGNQECRSNMAQRQSTWSIYYVHVHYNACARVCVCFFFLTFWISFITKGVHRIAREENKFVWNEKFTFNAKYPVVKITNISLLFISWTSKISLTMFCWRIHINLSLSLSPQKKKFDWGCAKSFFFFLFSFFTENKTKQNKINPIKYNLWSLLWLILFTVTLARLNC